MNIELTKSFTYFFIRIATHSEPYQKNPTKFLER